MHPALILDKIVGKVARWHPALRAMIRPLLYPLVRLRMQGIAHALATECRWLPPTTWQDVAKHGENVVYGLYDCTDVFTKHKKTMGVWTVDYRYRTVRIVLDAPERYQKVGAYF